MNSCCFLEKFDIWHEICVDMQKTDKFKLLPGFRGCSGSKPECAYGQSQAPLHWLSNGILHVKIGPRVSEEIASWQKKILINIYKIHWIATNNPKWTAILTVWISSIELTAIENFHLQVFIMVTVCDSECNHSILTFSFALSLCLVSLVDVRQN